MELVGAGDEVFLDFELMPQDLARVVRWALARQRVNWVFAILGTVLAVLGAILALTVNKINGPAIVLLVVGLGYPATIGLIWWRAPRMARRALAHEGGRRQVRLSATGVQVKTTLAEVTQQWAAFQEAIELGDMYLLRRGKRSAFVIIPKRALADADVERRLRALIAHHTTAQLRCAGHGPLAQPGP